MLRNAIKFLELISISGQHIYAEFRVDKLPLMKFEIKSPGLQFAFSHELAAVEAGLGLLSRLCISDSIQITLAQATRYASRILEMDQVLGADAKSFRIQIPASDVTLAAKEIVCFSFFSTPVGGIWIGTFVTIIGKPILADGIYNVFATDRTIERVVVREQGEVVPRDDLIAAALEIEQKYEGQYDVVTLFDKNLF